MISIKLEVGWLDSEPIYINTDVKKSISNSYVIAVENGYTFLTLHTETEVVHLLLSSIYENNLRVLILSSAYVVSNYTYFSLKMWPIAVQSNDHFELPYKNQCEDKNYQTLHSNVNKSTETDVMGNPIISFNNLSKFKGKY